jgi:uncharacterized Zn-finger protein
MTQHQDAVDILLKNLNDLPAPDLTNMNMDLYSFPSPPSTPYSEDIHAAGSMNLYMSPTAMSPGEPLLNGLSMTPLMNQALVSPPLSQQFPLDWPVRPRADSVFEPMLPSDFQPTVHRTMSLPHINYPTMMEFKLPNRKNSVCSVSSTTSSNGEKNFVCTHPGCDKAFARVQNLRSHMRCHLTTTPHHCKHCGMGFRRTTDLQRHIRTMHTPNDQKPWACPKCPKRFGRSDALKRHLQSKSKDHGCPGAAMKLSLPTVVEGSVF